MDEPTQFCQVRGPVNKAYVDGVGVNLVIVSRLAIFFIAITVNASRRFGKVPRTGDDSVWSNNPIQPLGHRSLRSMAP